MLINNAGVASGRLLLDVPDEIIQRTFDVNIVAHFWVRTKNCGILNIDRYNLLNLLQTTKAFLPKMLEKNHGHIVTIASMAGHVGIAKMVDYCASKHAAVGFDEALGIELETIGDCCYSITGVVSFFSSLTTTHLVWRCSDVFCFQKNILAKLCTLVVDGIRM